MTEERPTTKYGYIQLKLAKQTKKYSYHSQLMNGRSLDLLLLSTKSSGVTLQMKAPERYLLILFYSASRNIIKVTDTVKKKKKRNRLSTKVLANPSVCFGLQ